jgi:hypothetical protein
MTYISTSRHIVLTVTVAVAFMLLALIPVGLGSAQADNGFCGVRDGNTQEDGVFTYIVRNKCASGHDFRVEAEGVSTGCYYVGAEELGYFDLRVGTSNWDIIGC